MRLRRLLLILLCFVSVSVFPQSKEADKEALGRALEYFQSQKYHEALLIFQRLDQSYKLNARYKAYIGLCYYYATFRNSPDLQARRQQMAHMMRGLRPEIVLKPLPKTFSLPHPVPPTAYLKTEADTLSTVAIIKPHLPQTEPQPPVVEAQTQQAEPQKEDRPQQEEPQQEEKQQQAEPQREEHKEID